MLAHKYVLQFPNIGERLSSQQFARHVHRLISFFLAPHAHGVKILERQAKRIHSIVATAAQRFIAVHFQRFPQGGFVVLEVFSGVFQRRNVRGRRRGRHA